MGRCAALLSDAVGRRLPLVSDDLEDVFTAMRTAAACTQLYDDMLALSTALTWFRSQLPNLLREAGLLRTMPVSAAVTSRRIPSFDDHAEAFRHGRMELPSSFISAPPEIRHLTEDHPSVGVFSSMKSAVSEMSTLASAEWDELSVAEHVRTARSLSSTRTPEWAGSYSAFMTDQVAALEAAYQDALGLLTVRDGSVAERGTRAAVAADSVLKACVSAAAGETLGPIRSAHSTGVNWLAAGGNPFQGLERGLRLDRCTTSVWDVCPVCVLQGVARATRMISSVVSRGTEREYSALRWYLSEIRLNASALSARLISGIGPEAGPIML